MSGITIYWVTNNLQAYFQSQSHFTTGGLSSISSSWRQAPWDSGPAFFFQLKHCCHSPYVTALLTRKYVCYLQLLLTLASAVNLGSDSCGTHDHILLSQIGDSPNLEGQVPVFISPRNRVAQLYPQAPGSLFVASCDSQGYGGATRTRLQKGEELRSKLCPAYSSSGRTNRKHSSSIFACVYIAAITKQRPLFTESSLNSASTCYNMFFPFTLNKLFHPHDLLVLCFSLPALNLNTFHCYTFSRQSV
jgi:hypothetical protein